MDNLQNGIAAFKDGKRDEARKYFVAAMKENPNNENVWGWLYQVSNNDKEKIEALKRVVAINPKNIKAQELLNQLLAAPITTTPSLHPPQTEKISATSSLPKKKNNNSLMLILGGIAVIVVICCIIILASSGSTLTGNKAKYVVTGSAASAMITYFNEQGGTEQVDVSLPFEKELSIKPGSFLSLVAQNGDTGSITCEIWINGEKTKTSTSTAQYGVVTCTDFK